jgi:hypothetical protein
MSFFNWGYKISRWVIAGLFLYAAVTKLLEPEAFAVLIDAYGLVPDRLLLPLAVILPLIELMAGIGLLFDIRGSLAAVAALLGFFIAILGYGIWMGLDVDCGCFGPGDPEAEAFHGLKLSFYRDLAMLAAVIFIYGWRQHRDIEPVKIIQFIKKRFNKRKTDDAYA